MLLGWQDADVSITTLAHVAAESIIGGVFGVLVGSALGGVRWALPYTLYLSAGETLFWVLMLLIVTVSSMATGFLLGWPAARPSGSLGSVSADAPAPHT
jgi:hypothetical protein